MASKSLSEGAAMGALESLGLGGGGAMTPPMPEEAMAPVEGGGGIEDGLMMVESALAGAPPDLADEARTHINALREIGSQIGGAPAEPVPAAEEPLPPGVGGEV